MGVGDTLSYGFVNWFCLFVIMEGQGFVLGKELEIYRIDFTAIAFPYSVLSKKLREWAFIG